MQFEPGQTPRAEFWGPHDGPSPRRRHTRVPPPSAGFAAAAPTPCVLEASYDHSLMLPDHVVCACVQQLLSILRLCPPMQPVAIPGNPVTSHPVTR